MISARFAGATQAVGLEFTDGRNVAVGAVGEGRLIYNDSTHTFQVSQNGGAFVDIDTGTSGTLQAAYNAGAAIVVTAANPVAITNAAAVNSGLLTLIASACM